jgi:aldose 1-epimerase
LSPITLRQGAAQASLLPHLGGAVGSFTIEGRAVLRPTPEHATDPLETACFPLVPYPNRIAAGRFTFAGKAYAIPPNHPAFPHPLHGLGWLKPWAVTAQAQNTAALTCSHKADENWPWDWSATQRFELSEHALRITLELVNGAEQAMPAGLGLHPYFVRRAGDALRFAAAGVWHNDEAMLPVRPGAADALGDFMHGAMPSERSLIDNCFFGWTGAANWGEAVTVTATGSSFLHVYAPPGEDFVCLEPTSQMPDALNQADFLKAGGTVLKPGASQVLGMEIGVRR